jgi:hypothetical protein
VSPPHAANVTVPTAAAAIATVLAARVRIVVMKSPLVAQVW